MGGGEDGLYMMGVAYLSCLALTYLISLVWIVKRLGQLMAEMRGSSSGVGIEGSGRILELVFSGWDHLEVGKAATRSQRYTLVKQLLEELEAANVAEVQKLTVSRKFRRRQQALRGLGISLSLVLLVGGGWWSRRVLAARFGRNATPAVREFGVAGDKKEAFVASPTIGTAMPAAAMSQVVVQSPL